MAARTLERTRPPAEPISLQDWYDMKEAAAILHRTENALRQLRTKGKGPRFRKVDGRLLVAGSDLERYLRGEAAS
jgi:hypothetical protein